MARDPFSLPEGLHIYPPDFRIRPLDFELGTIWPSPIDRGSGAMEMDETPFTHAGLQGFGPIYLDSLGGPRNAPALVRHAFEGKIGPETRYRLDPRRARRPLLRLKGPDTSAIWLTRTIRAITREDVTERRFVLLVLLILTGTTRDADKGVAIRLALDVANLAERYDAAMRQGMFLGMLTSMGVTGERALEEVARRTKASVGTVRANRVRPVVKAVTAAFASRGTLRASSLPHLADEWFAAGQEREVAMGLAFRAIAAIKRNERPDEGLRWALLVLCEGYWRRDRSLPAEAVYALAACLELVDPDGRPRRHLPLAGVTHRRAFMELAAAEAWDEFDDYFHRMFPADPKTHAAWLDRPLHLPAKEVIRAQLLDAGWDDSKIEGDHSEAD